MGLPSKALLRARELVEKGWTQKAYGRDKTGCDQLSVLSEHCVSFCVTGAAIRAANEAGLALTALSDYLAAALGRRGIPPVLERWNDAPERTKEDALQLLDEAIALSIKAEKADGASTSSDP